MAEPQRQALSPDNPWPGLDPFEEIERKYFHGRAEESGELMRLVRRELLTVLFGRSGLGKTSLLKAGLFPLLREEDCLPVYVRLDHADPADTAPALREQIFRGLQAACDAGGVQAARPAADESPWSFFHRSDAELWSERNRCPVTPVIVFDQFEEIFTLGQETEASRARSDVFLAELGDLVENRPPDAVRRALEADPTAATRFDFKRSNVKLVLSFREDFLAEMEGLKERMPSLMYNRFRLLAMSGGQAYEVITYAGGTLVDDDVARRIIRLAWKNEPSPPVDPSDFPKIEIDPALLSVVCSELNHKRRQAKPPLERITPALLEDADREILAGFYERGMAGLDPRVRAFVEDKLITDDGRHRDSHAKDNALALPGVTEEALGKLIQRRLLRVDDRQSVRRLELTHDVLTRVVKDSRDRRRAREAEEAALKQQKRNRRNAAFVLAGAVVVIVLTAAAGWFAWAAKQMLHEAESARLMANADRLQDANYDTSLLVNLEAVRIASTLDAQAGLLRRFASHPYLAEFLGNFLRWMEDSDIPALDVAFRPDLKRMASTFGNAVTLWDVVGREELATFRGHEDDVVSVAFSPDGEQLASASKDKTVVLWDISSQKSLATLKGHKNALRDVAFSPNGKRLASASDDKTVIIWDVSSHKLLATLEGHRDAVRAVAFSPNGELLASASKDKTVILWDVSSHKPLATLEGHQDAVRDVAFSPNGEQLASASEDGTVILWDVASGKRQTTLKEHKAAIVAVAFSPNGEWLASGSEDKTVILWDVASGMRQAALEGHKDVVVSVAFSRDGKQLVSASEDRAVILWDVNSRRLLTTLKGSKDAVISIAFSRDGKRLVSQSQDSTMVWDVASHKPLSVQRGHLFRSDDSSPNGWLIAMAGEENTVTLWDRGIWDATRHSLQGHKGEVEAVAFSWDGKLLASASRDKTVILWDLDSRKPLAMLEGHKDGVEAVAFSPDGKWLASASLDKTVILWDLERRQPLATLEGHKDGVDAVAFSWDGKLLASASLDKTVILWDLDLDHLKAEACRTANRNLTCEEWRDYMGVDKPYRKTCAALPGPEKCD